MQIVIDIPDILYTKIQNGKADKRTLETVILHGTPLPEGHGRLIDADKIEFEYYYGEWFVTEAAIDHQPTVLEPDAESEETNADSN